MKPLLLVLIAIFYLNSTKAQIGHIETKSAEINDFISFVVNNYNSADHIDRQITFLIQLDETQLSGENLIMLRQSFKLISERLTQNSKIAIVAYSKYNGVALQFTSAKEIKLILNTLTDLKSNISEFYPDGISLAYTLAKDHSNENVENSVVIIRIAHKAKNDMVTVEDLDKQEAKSKKKQKTKAILTTALALLPELIDIIKN